MRRQNIFFLVALLAATSAQAADTFIHDWNICGPFPSHSVKTAVVEREAALTPDADVAGKAWKAIHSASDVVDLEAGDALGHSDYAVAFAFTDIEVDDEADIAFGIGSDDAVMVWWNGRPVLIHDVLRGAKPGEDQVIVHARKGKNSLLLKVYDAAGGWGFVVDMRRIHSDGP